MATLDMWKFRVVACDLGVDFVVDMFSVFAMSRS